MITETLVLPPAAIVPLGAGILCGLCVEFRPVFDGRASASPDGCFLARAKSTYGPRVPGGSKSCYEFVVEDRAGTRLQHIEVPVPREDLINWRLEGSITWADDSSCVKFEFKQTSLTLNQRHPRSRS
jgi:hypothetical protein